MNQNEKNRNSVLQNFLSFVEAVAFNSEGKNAAEKPETKAKIACVFDMDSTLFGVSSRTQAILRELALEESFSSQFSDIAGHLKEIAVEQHDWGIRPALERLNYPFTSEQIQVIRGFWRKHFFSNRYLAKDVLYEGSNSFVQLCEALNCEIYYLTGRSEHSMKAGTLKQLEAHSFPLKKHEHLIMKTKEDEHDEDFKLNRLKGLVREFDHVYFFENEPVITESISRNLPEVKIIFMDSTHSARRPKPTELETITPESFKEVLHWLEKYPPKNGKV